MMVHSITMNHNPLKKIDILMILEFFFLFHQVSSVNSLYLNTQLYITLVKN